MPRYAPGRGNIAMDLTLWIPAMLLLGLVTMGLFFAFLAVCEHV